MTILSLVEDSAREQNFAKNHSEGGKKKTLNRARRKKKGKNKIEVRGNRKKVVELNTKAGGTQMW